MKQLIADVVYEIWKKIDWERVAPGRRKAVWDEMTTKIRRAAKARSVSQFVANLCRYWDIQSLSDTEILTKLEALNTKEQDEFLSIAREEPEYITWLVRAMRDRVKETKKDKTGGLFHDKA